MVTSTTTGTHLRVVQDDGRTTAYWICVVSREDAHRAQVEGRIRLPAKSRARAARLAEGDGLVVYSPREGNRSGPAVRRFTAVGTVGPGEPYVLQGDPHVSWCRDVRFEEVEEEVEVVPLLDRLGFVQPGPGWGVVFRPGFLQVTSSDFDVVRDALVGRVRR